jgi:hypothetical protein
MQTAIVILILALAAMYVFRRFWRARQGESCCSGSGCGGSCGCSGGQGKTKLEPLTSANRGNVDSQLKGSCTSCGCGSREPADKQNS